MRSSLLAISSALLFVPSPSPAAESYTLTDRWQVNFGRGQDRAVYRTTACPDGSFYLSDSFGRVAVINAAGHVTSRQLRREFASAQALACDADSRLYIAQAGEILILRAAVMVSRWQTDVSISALAPAENGVVYACGTRPGTRLPLHRIARDGRDTSSFGDSRLPFSRVYPRVDGPILWQPDQDRLLFMPHSAWNFEIQAFGPDGDYLGAYGTETNFIQPVRVAGPQPWLGQAIAAARLPGGEIVIQRAVYSWGLRLPSQAQEIHDSGMRRLGITAADARLLVGAAGDGDLYLANLSPHGLQVFKAGLVKRLGL